MKFYAAKFADAQLLLKRNAKNIPQVFKSSKPEVKRRLINLVLSNPSLNDVTVSATIRKPFSRWAKGSSCSIWGQLQDVFRNPTDEFREEVLTYNTILKTLEASLRG